MNLNFSFRDFDYIFETSIKFYMHIVCIGQAKFPFYFAIILCFHMKSVL